MDITEILDAYTPPERSIEICLRGDLVGTYEELDRQLRSAETRARSLSEPADSVAIAQRMAELREQMLAGSATFRFRGLPADPYGKLVAAHSTDDIPNRDTFPQALIAACAVEPVMTVEQVDQLRARLTDMQLQALYDTALETCRRNISVPFSQAASEVLRKPDPS